MLSRQATTKHGPLLRAASGTMLATERPVSAYFTHSCRSLECTRAGDECARFDDDLVHVLAMCCSAVYCWQRTNNGLQ